MKKAKSSASLTNLAHSIKKSIQHDSKPFSSTQRPIPNNKQTENISFLHHEIQKLEKELSLNQFSSKKMKSKHYEQQLNKYEIIGKSIQINCQKLRKQKENVATLRNRLCMLKQDHSSKQMNLEDQLAEMQYHEEIIQKYKYQYEGESQAYLEILKEMNKLQKIKTQISQLELQIDTKQRSLISWRQESGFDLSEKVNKQKISQLRISLMKVQDEANKYAEQTNLLKFRQILCIFLKQYASENSVILNQKEMSEGMEIFICKQQLVEQYHEAVIKYRNKGKVRYQSKVIQEYFTLLTKMQSLLASPKFKQDQRINNQIKNQIQNARKLLIIKQDLLCHTNGNIKQLQKILDEVFSNYSVVVIEHLRQNCGKYELQEIKKCLKKLKKQQKIRLAEIKVSYQRLEKLESRVNSIDSIFYMNEYSEIQKKLGKQTKQLKILQKQQKQLSDEKTQIEDEINLGISKWKQASIKKQELRQLYRRLNLANRDVRDSKLQLFRQNTCKLSLKPSSSLASLRQTVKMKIERQNKENEPRNTESRKKYTKSNFDSDINCLVTRKPSLMKTGRSTKALSLKQTNRASLASMVLTRLAK